MADGIDGMLGLFADEIARRIGKVVARELRGDDPNWVDQSLSKLGRRRHVAAVKRRLAEGKLGAVIRGRRHLLNQEAYAEELGAPPPSRPGIKKVAEPAPPDPVESLRDELARMRGQK